MKFFFKTQIITLSFLLFYAIFLYLSSIIDNYDSWMLYAGFALSFFLTIVVTTLIAKQNFLTICYAFINYILDIIFMYGIFLVFSFRNIYLDDGGFLFFILLSLPITIPILIIGCLLGVTINMFRNKKKYED